MRKRIFALFAMLISILAFAQSSHRVKVYSKKNGSYVPSHNKTKSDKTERNNYSSKPNTNPYTGKKGTKKPKK